MKETDNEYERWIEEEDEQTNNDTNQDTDQSQEEYDATNAIKDEEPLQEKELDAEEVSSAEESANDREQEIVQASEEKHSLASLGPHPDPHGASFAVQGSPGDTIETAEGFFTVHDKKTTIEPLESGPIRIEFEQVSLVSGDVTEPSIAGIAGDEVEFIQADILIQNTGNEPMQNIAPNLVFESGGVEFHAHSMFSGLGAGYDPLTDSTPQKVTLIFMVDDLISIDDIYSLYGIFPSPVNVNSGATTSDAMRFNFSFSN